MKTTRLIKKQELRQLHESVGSPATAQVSRGNNKETVRQWVKEYKQTRYAKPQSAFAALFGEAM